MDTNPDIMKRVLETAATQGIMGQQVSTLSNSVSELLLFQRQDSGRISVLETERTGANGRLKKLETTLEEVKPVVDVLEATVVKKEDLATATAQITAKLTEKLAELSTNAHKQEVAVTATTTKLDTKQAVIYGVAAAVAGAVLALWLPKLFAG